MFAILVTEENLAKIMPHQAVLQIDNYFYPDLYLQSSYDWYYIRGYVDSKGKPVDWVVYPGQMFARKFEYNPDKIKTDWDQIVRK